MTRLYIHEQEVEKQRFDLKNYHLFSKLSLQ